MSYQLSTINYQLTTTSHQPKLLFHRHYRQFQGGHLKVFHYFRHAQDLPGWRPQIYFHPDSRWDAGNPWLPWRSKCLKRFEPHNADMLFLAGMDWMALPESQRRLWPRPVINLVQGVRHANPDLALYGFLSCRAVRICVSHEVKEALEATQAVNGPLLVIPNGLELGELTPPNETQGQGRLLVVGNKCPQAAHKLVGDLRPAASRAGFQVTLLDAPLPRPAFLTALAEAEIAVFLPLPQEGFYLPALEAMALGRLVVCPDCVGNRSFCQDRKNCYRPAYTLPEIAAAALGACTATPKDKGAMRTLARQTAQAHDLARERAAFGNVLHEARRLYAPTAIRASRPRAPNDTRTNTVMLTGIPRSGTTLCCRLLNALPDVAALHEPLPMLQLAGLERGNALLAHIAGFCDKARQSLVRDGIAPSRHQAGRVTDNPLAEDFAGQALRSQVHAGVAPVQFNKSFSPDTLIVIKHNAPFTALLGLLKTRFSCFAVVRNPLAVLLSWQTVAIPVQRGRIPAGEVYDSRLQQVLEELTDPLARQIHILHWCCEQFLTHLPSAHILRYEHLVATGGTILNAIAPAARQLVEALHSRNHNPLYPLETAPMLADRLLASSGPLWEIYTRREVENLVQNSGFANTTGKTVRPVSDNRNNFTVNFLIAGAQKAGTSALAHFLMQHPEVCLCPRKEAHFFDKPDFPDHLSPKDLNHLYQKHFPNYRYQPLVGDATPAYLFLPQVPARIAAYNPAMRIICLLRDPVERALSQYAMERSRGTETNPLLVSMLWEWWRYRNEPDNYDNLNRDRPVRRFCYRERGRYDQQLARWMNYFPQNQILVLRTEALWQYHAETLCQVYAFLGITPPYPLPEQERVFSTNHLQRPGWLTRWVLKKIMAVSAHTTNP